ncbi:MAG: S49 family peptidase [Gemmataceae bacterium]
MKRNFSTGSVLLLMAGCVMPLRTESAVKMDGNVNGHVEANVKMQGKMEAHVRTEQSPLVDPGPLLEVPVPPVGPECGCKVAVVDVDGVLANLNNVGPFSLGENPVAAFKEKLDACAADPCVKAVVLRINTPGGAVAATDLMWHELVRFRQATGKPVVACLLDLGTGGGYFLATGCDAVYAIPSAVVGGVGVLLNLWDGKDNQGQAAIYPERVVAGEKIDMGTLIRKLTPQEKEILEGMAKGYHQRFKEVVTKARPKAAAKPDLFDGRVMAADQALQAGLIDGVGYPDEAIAAACQLAKVGPAQPVMYRRQGDQARSLYATTPNRPISSGGLLGLNIPGPDRAKLPTFLYMWLPEPAMLKLGGL